MSSRRKRVDRRARARLEGKEARDFQRALADRGLLARIDKVREAVAPQAPMFWMIIKQRIAARETFKAIRSLEQIRALAMEILRADGHDLTGIVLKVFWQPPVLAFDPVPSVENATAVVEEVRATARGRDRLRQIRALGG
jgi:hypothetical protein